MIHAWHAMKYLIIVTGSSTFTGASLVETYTGLAYEGPAFVPRAKQELADALARDGFTSVQQAVGLDHR